MRSTAAPVLGTRGVFIASLLASGVCPAGSLAESPPRAADARLQVTVSVVPACSIDSRGALSVRCGNVGRVMIETGPVQYARVGETHDGRFSITTINF